jgi:hypothetical protein
MEQHPPNLLSDLVSLDACFHGLNDLQLWLLHELYGPGGFNPRPRPLAELFDAARTRFPDHDWTLHRIAQFKREALKIYEAHLMRERLM